MKTKISSLPTLTLVSLLAFASATEAAPSKIDLDGPESPQWLVDSRKTRDERIQWFKEAKFGMFVHWGVYSQLGGVWKGHVVQGYAEHIMRIEHIPLKVYASEVASNFNPVLFNADQWIQTCKNTGMRYFVITAKHHDGFAMWPSHVNNWNIADATPFKRDPLAELHDACQKYAIHFGVYYSHAQDWSHPGGQRNPQDFPGQPTKKGKWFRDPKYAGHIALSEQYIREKSIPQLLELVYNYHPELIWFDTSSWVPMYQNKMVVEALRKVAPNTVINSRAGKGLGDYRSTVDQPMDLQPYYLTDDAWEAIPTINLSYGYNSRDKNRKPASFFIKLLAKTVENGGNMLLNVGPMGNGQMAPEDLAVLDGIGRWMRVNGDAIYGTTHTPLPPQTWGHVARKTNDLYLHVTHWPVKGQIEVGGLVTPISKAFLLSDPDRKPLPVKKIGDADWMITGPDTAPDPINTVVQVECAGEPVGKALPILVSTKVPHQRLHFFEGEVEGLKRGNGAPDEDMAHGWDKQHKDARVSWRVRALEPGDFDVAISYLALKGKDGGTYKVTVGNQSFVKNVEVQPVPSFLKTVKYPEHVLGTVHLEPGEYDVVITADSITGRELMAPQAVYFDPK